MTKESAKQYLGKTGRVRLGTLGSLQFDVTITDHRYVFGRDDVEISPVAGIGKQWVAADSVTIKEGK